MKFLHYGIPTKNKIKEKEYNFVEKIGLHTTDPSKDFFSLQYVWAEDDSILPDIVKEKDHISFGVENISDVIMKFDEVVFPPTRINEKMTIAFAMKDGILFELMEENNIDKS